jgi:hypothetical protein
LRSGRLRRLRRLRRLFRPLAFLNNKSGNPGGFARIDKTGIALKTV